jgi:CPA2 family monovalent cation:H+ antiporter-2
VNQQLVVETLTLIGASALCIALLSRIGLPAMLGYLFAGVVIGPLGVGLVPASEGAQFLAELGLILLMFMVGLEFSWAEIWAARRAVFVAGSLQFALSTTAAAAAAAFAGLSWPAAIMAGAAAAMCSTGITLRQLQEQRELANPHGRLVTGMLLFQDLATLPLLVIIDSRRLEDSSAFMTAIRQLAIAGISLAILLWACRPVLRMALSWIARRKSVDLFLLSALLLALGTAYVSERLGAAPLIGAFFAGVAVGESDIRHRVYEHLRPFRDMLLGLFFVTVGMQVNVGTIVAAPVQALTWLGFFLLVKPMTAAVAGRLAGYHFVSAARAGVVLSHASEMTLLIVTQAIAGGLLPARAGQPMLIAAAVSMGLAPLIIENNRRITARILRASMKWSRAQRTRRSLDRRARYP